MKRLHTLYTLLVVAALTFQVACDDSEEVTTDEMAGTPTAGTEMAGTEMAGTEMAGTEMAGADAGTEMGGTDAGTEMGGTDAGTEMAGTDAGTEMAGDDTPVGGDDTPRMGPGNTDPTVCSGDYCPSARLSALNLPQTPEDAYAGGCRLASEKNGTALGGLLTLAGGDVNTNDFVSPDEDGNIQLILLNHLNGWDEGQTGNDAGEVRADFYTGVQDAENQFSIDPVSLDGEAPIIYFDGTTVTDGLYQTPPSDFIVDIPLVEGFPLQLRLSQTEVSGFVTVDDIGFNMTEGVLGGYLTRDAIIELINGINMVCASDTPPDLCGTVSTFLTGNAEADLGLLVPILGGFDSAVAGDGSVSACAGDSPDCNAISVCILLEMSSTKINGVAAE